MNAALAVLIVLAALDLAACGLLLLLAWAEHRRVRRRAAEIGEPVPPPATGSFALLAVGGLLGILILYAAAALLAG